MPNLIDLAFKKVKQENRPALLTYTVAGDNSKKKSLEILKSISNYADILELGVPHNALVADGNQIQTSALNLKVVMITLSGIGSMYRFRSSGRPRAHSIVSRWCRNPHDALGRDARAVGSCP